MPIKKIITVLLSMAFLYACEQSNQNPDSNTVDDIVTQQEIPVKAPAPKQAEAPADEAVNKLIDDIEKNINIDFNTVTATIETELGNIKLRFFYDIAPKHVENFIQLSQSGFYDGTIFHRVIPGFMIQGGDPNTKDISNTGLYGQGGPGYKINAEFNDKSHKRGILSMARSSHPNSAGSQFFIVVKDSPFLDKQYTVFGEVVEGMDIADKIVSQPRDGRDNPKQRIEMKVSIN